MHWFLDPIQNHYADFNGRTTRQEYWMFVLFSFLVSIIVGIIAGVLDIVLLSHLFQLGIFVPSVAIGVRRLHDIDKSGWWMFISLIPIVGTIVLIVWLVGESKDEGNQYGPGAITSSGTPVQASASQAMTEEQIAYVRTQLQAGYDEPALRELLAGSGYSAEQIDALFVGVKNLS